MTAKRLCVRWRCHKKCLWSQDLDHLLYLSLTSNWRWIDYCGLRRADKPSLVPPVLLSIYSFFLILYIYIPFVSWPSHIFSYLYPRIDWACLFLDSCHFRHLFCIFANFIQASTHSEKYISKTTYYHSFGDQSFLMYHLLDLTCLRAQSKI